ncbi:hypothetical protein IQ265_19400 [Nodosilinea sp. LEGE 06152]|uniref:hypothetical protein n=1 Tax=Nodosilinea sp. LEGE 06152 TaxID=2777966 RepID=UPI001880B313|nr:hypothetical protein [Nodosilinea sp. LEGE 06152]MBE9158984.1 hypothetical protein [Nodosilinea sp. LEGE 06152]
MVSPVISRPALDVSPAPPSRSTAALLRPKWRRSLPPLKHPQMWALGLGSLALGLVNGALVISAGIGLVAYQQILQLSPRQRKGLMQRLQQGLPLPTSPQQQALILAAVAGASTYTFTALWHSTHSLLMALLLTGQGALALFAVGALLRSSRSADPSDDLWNAAPVAQVEHNLGLLSHPDPLKRLVAVRRLVRLAQTDEEYLVGMSVRSHLVDCFQLRLSQETDAIVRSALEEGLALLQPTQSLSPSLAAPVVAERFAPEPFAQAVADEVVLEPEASAPVPELRASTEVAAPASQGRRTVEYVEYLDI